MHSIERFLQDITELKERHRTATESLASLWASYEEVIALKPKRGRSFDKTPLTDRDWVMLRNWFPGYFPVNSDPRNHSAHSLLLNEDWKLELLLVNTQREANEMVIALQEEERVVEEMAVLQLIPLPREIAEQISSYNYESKYKESILGR
ncbi:hypothetical protein MMC10_011358 [Thelotrema lepadinum]|nr:hypothetical protein [Thelotrema lepadinum]